MHCAAGPACQPRRAASLALHPVAAHWAPRSPGPACQPLAFAPRASTDRGLMLATQAIFHRVRPPLSPTPPHASPDSPAPLHCVPAAPFKMEPRCRWPNPPPAPCFSSLLRRRARSTPPHRLPLPPAAGLPLRPPPPHRSRPPLERRHAGRSPPPP
jgi:hypothetical protein